MADLWMLIKCVLLIQIQFHQLLWFLGGKRKRWEKTHFDIFRSIDCDLSTYSPKSWNSNILVSTHPIGKIEIVPESLSSREDMVKNPFWYFECFTSKNPCDSSPPSKHGFSFLNPNIPFFLETWSKWLNGCLI